jgi:hypothetical protein
MTKKKKARARRSRTVTYQHDTASATSLAVLDAVLGGKFFFAWTSDVQELSATSLPRASGLKFRRNSPEKKE